MATPKKYCKRCGRTLVESNFYATNNLTKYPDGKLDTCKECATRHVDNWDKDTFLWLLEEIDIPYVPSEWNRLLAKYATDPRKVKGTTIMGRYISSMKLQQYRNYRFKDSEWLQEIQNNLIAETLREQSYTEQQIDEEMRKRELKIPEGNLRELALEKVGVEDIPENTVELIARPDIPQETISLTPEPEEDYGLTDDDILYLRTKWGPGYKQSEWIYMERLWNDMMDSYDIQTAGHFDTLKKVCKASLKMDQLIDISDIEGFQKMSRAYNDLMKSGNFQAIQNKTAEEEGVDSFSELIQMAEEQGFIPRYYADGPQDKVDRVLQDMQNYTKNLVDSEGALSNMLEQAIKDIIRDKEKEAKIEDDEESLEDELFAEDSTESILRDEDYEDFELFKEGLRTDDEEMYY